MSWTFNEDGTGSMRIAGALSMQFAWESCDTDKVTIMLVGPSGQSQKQPARWAVSGDTLTFTPETLTLKRASAQPASQHPKYLAHTWTSEPSFSKGLKQTAVFEKTGALTPGLRETVNPCKAPGKRLAISLP